jgi:LEA14-like dessication related protein
LATIPLGRPLKILVVTVVILVIVVIAVVLYIGQYRHLAVDVDSARSGYSIEGTDVYRLTLVLRLTNSGDVDLLVPPTTFDVYIDGVKAGPGEAESVTVPANSMAWTTAVVEVDRTMAPLAYLALVDNGEDTITLVGEAHVDLGFTTLDYPFEESFKMDV